ncbi:MAG: acyl-CoA thioester hydrolase [Mariniblastus sp.]|jgi:acyl-CoA thioester hydrolase
MSEVFVTQRRVEFRDTDMAGIAHFSNFFAYMEQAEHSLLRSLNLGVICVIDDREISFPRVNAQCDYLNAIRFEDMIEIQVVVTNIGTKSITYGFKFFRDQTPVAKGSITVVCCLMKHGERPESVPTPQKFIDSIKPYLIAE